MSKKFTVAELVEMYSVETKTVLAWIHSGALKAINVSRGKTLPRWRISADAIDEFEALRTAKPLPKLKKRRKRKVTEGIYPTS